MQTDEAVDRLPVRAVVLEAVFLWAMFLAYSLTQATIPGVNETHYLSKSRHVWQPEWCEGDLFLESSNPHLVFYRTIGWLTSVTDFETAALLARGMCLLILAGGWAVLTSRVSRQFGVGLLSAAGFLLLATLGNWSGEWVVGGAESKVPSYGFALAAIGLACDGRLRWAGLLSGLAISYHPVVGVWAVLAIGVMLLVETVFGTARPAWKDIAIAVGLLGVAALPGVIPALTALGGGTAEQSLDASRYQVTRRLAHHLNPSQFSLPGYRLMLLLSAIAAVFATLTVGWGPRRRLLTVAGAAVLFATVGVVIGITGDLSTSDWRVTLLKFYPFRLADAVLPIAVCVIFSDYALIQISQWRPQWWTTGLAIGTTVLLGVALWIPAHDRDSSRLSAENRADWITTLTWVRENTREDALILAADTEWAVKWFAQRPEYANYKDCPQDPASLAEWRRRRGVMYRWSKDALADGSISDAELRAFREETGVTHLISGRFGPIKTPPAFRSGRYRVTAIP